MVVVVLVVAVCEEWDSCNKSKSRLSQLPSLVVVAVVEKLLNRI